MSGIEQPTDPYWFDGVARFLGAAYLRNAFTKGTEQEVDFLVDALALESGMRVLDVGCGPGRHSLALARRGFGVVGVDHSAEFVGLAREAAAAEGVAVEFEELDVRDLDRAGEFDATVCLCQGGFGLLGGRDETAVFGRIAATLRAGGRLAVSAFSAAFAVRHLEPKEEYDPATGVLHERAVVRDPAGREEEFDLWTTCFTARELELLAAGAGLTVDAVHGVTPGAYRAGPPTLDHHELLLLARRDRRGVPRLSGNAARPVPCCAASPRGPPLAPAGQPASPVVHRRGVELPDQDATEAAVIATVPEENGAAVPAAPEAEVTTPAPEAAVPEAAAPETGEPGAGAAAAAADAEEAEEEGQNEFVVFDDLGGQSFADAVDATIVEFDDGDIVIGRVVKIDSDEVLLDIGFKSEGVIPSRELSIRNDVDPNEIVSLDDELEALVLQKEDKDGRLILSKKRARVRARLGHDRRDQGEGRDRQGPGHRGGQGRPDPRHRSARLPPRVARRSPPRARPPALRGQGDRVQDHRARQEPEQRRVVPAGVPRGDPARAA